MVPKSYQPKTTKFLRINKSLLKGKDTSVNAMAACEINVSKFETSYIEQHTSKVIGSGRFGTVKLFKISHLEIIVCGKQISTGVREYQAELRAHSLVSGHHALPSLCGRLDEQGNLLIEFIVVEN